MDSLAARLAAGRRDNMGADTAREAAEALKEAARQVAELAAKGDSALLVGALVRLNEATVAAEQLYDRQISVAMIFAAGQAARPGLRSVS